MLERYIPRFVALLALEEDRELVILQLLRHEVAKRARHRIRLRVLLQQRQLVEARAVAAVPRLTLALNRLLAVGGDRDGYLALVFDVILAQVLHLQIAGPVNEELVEEHLDQNLKQLDLVRPSQGPLLELVEHQLREGEVEGHQLQLAEGLAGALEIEVVVAQHLDGHELGRRSIWTYVDEQGDCLGEEVRVRQRIDEDQGNLTHFNKYQEEEEEDFVAESV